MALSPPPSALRLQTLASIHNVLADLNSCPNCNFSHVKVDSGEVHLVSVSSKKAAVEVKHVDIFVSVGVAATLQVGQ